MSITIQIRNDTSANWTSANPILASGEVGYETDSRKSKLGDGVTAWNTLNYTVSDAVVSNDVVFNTVDPLTTTNPSSSNILFVNKTSGEIFICKDNTVDNNIWSGSKGTSVYPAGAIYVPAVDYAAQSKLVALFNWDGNADDTTSTYSATVDPSVKFEDGNIYKSVNIDGSSGTALGNLNFGSTIKSVATWIFLPDISDTRYIIDFRVGSKTAYAVTSAEKWNLKYCTVKVNNVDVVNLSTLTKKGEWFFCYIELQADTIGASMGDYNSANTDLQYMLHGSFGTTRFFNDFLTQAEQDKLMNEPSEKVV